MKRDILVVDDDAALRGMLQELLEGQGFSVRACEDADSALRAVRAEPPDLILLDVMMPGTDGFEFCRALRSEEGSRIPVIFLTAREDQKSRLQGFSCGGQDYVQKPCHLEELLARIEVHLEQQLERRMAFQKVDELELIERSRRDMTDMIVHDLKHPLTCIQGTVSLLLRQGLITEGRYGQMLEESRKMAQLMLLMLNDLLDLSRARAGGLKPEFGRVDAAELLDKLRSLFDSGIEERMIETEIAGDPVLRSDFMLLFRILANLLSNAVKFSERDSVVNLAYSSEGGKGRFRVEDRGLGIQLEDRERIFEKFARGASSGTEGAGIGLSFCRVAAEALGGSVWAEPREGGGSRFFLDIPSAPPGG